MVLLYTAGIKFIKFANDAINNPVIKRLISRFVILFLEKKPKIIKVIAKNDLSCTPLITPLTKISKEMVISANSKDYLIHPTLYKLDLPENWIDNADMSMWINDTNFSREYSNTSDVKAFICKWNKSDNNWEYTRGEIIKNGSVEATIYDRGIYALLSTLPNKYLSFSSQTPLTGTSCKLHIKPQ